MTPPDGHFTAVMLGVPFLVAVLVVVVVVVVVGVLVVLIHFCSSAGDTSDLQS